jgi:hypothetical protein
MGSNNKQTSRWRPFNKARAYVRKLGLANNQEWRAYVRGEYKNLKS